jgi:hypothetical protein
MAEHSPSSQGNTQDLLVIDQVPVFNEALDECRRACQALEKLKAELDQHDSKDLPAYERWLHATFGVHMTAIREASALIREKEILLASLRRQHWARFFGTSSGAYSESGLGRDDEEASEGLCGMHAHWTPYEEDPADLGDEERQEEYRYEESGSYYDDEERSWYDASESEASFEDYLFRRSERRNGGYRGRDWSQYERFRNRADERSGPDPEEPRVSTEAAEVPEDPKSALMSRIKERYRLLVKRLHPDINPDLTLEKKRLWNQVQAAHREQNLEQLDVLLALSDALSGALSEVTSLFQLRGATQEILRLLNPLQRKLDEAKQARAWRFSELRDRSHLHRIVEKEYRGSVIRLRQTLAQLDAQMERFARPQSPRSAERRAEFP